MTGAQVARIVRSLAQFYDAEPTDITPFLQTSNEPECRESLYLKEHEQSLELAVVLPEHVANGDWHDLDLDEQCQAIEGASHFLMLSERARNDQSTTHLELELQAEVDKWLILSNEGQIDTHANLSLREHLFDKVRFAHDEHSELGHRYRLANNLASKFVHQLSRRFVETKRFVAIRRLLLRFFRMNQEEKIRCIGV